MLTTLRQTIARARAKLPAETLPLCGALAAAALIALMAPQTAVIAIGALAGSIAPIMALGYRLQQPRQRSHFIAHDNDATRNTLAHAFAHFAGTDRLSLVTIENQKQIICYTDGRRIYSSRYMLQTLSPRQIAAVHAHEMGHVPEFFSSLEEPMNSLTATALLRGAFHASRVARGAGLGAATAMAATGAALSAGTIAGIICAPYLLNVAIQAHARHREYKADAHAAEIMGSPVPLSQVLRRMEGEDKATPHSELQQIFTALVLHGVTKAEVKAAFRRVVMYEGPLTQTHPSTRQRRQRLHRLPRNPQQQALITHLLENSASGLRQDGLSWLRRYS